MRITRQSKSRIVVGIVAALAVWGCSSLPTAPSVDSSAPGAAPSLVVQDNTPDLGGSGGISSSSGSSLTTDISALSSGKLALQSSTTQLASKLIDGAVGGEVSLGNWRVVIPAGAYVGVGTISVGIPDPTIRRCDLSISPASLNKFLVPVQLWCKFDSSLQAQTSYIYWWNPFKCVWTVVPSTAVLSSRVAPLSHFSTYQGGRAGW